MFLAVLAGQQKQAEGDRIQMLEAIAHLNRVASMGQMAASLAHELAQPLASILNNAQAGTQFASQPEPNVEEIRGAFADIIEEDRRARVVVQNTRAMFQRQEFACTQVDLNGIVNDVSRLVKNEALRRGVQIRVVPCPDAVVVVGEATALQQVILNLINNGMDALQELPYGSRILTLTTGIPPDSNFGTVLVEDNGCGITKENRQKLFTPFFTTKTEGLGMGLSICLSLIESFGGHITLVDRSGPGTVFQVEVPLAAHQSLSTSA
jgi:C4-dicarboxylate-specific signal transduction histidine kinase